MEHLPLAENILPHNFQEKSYTPSHGLSSLKQILNGPIKYQAANYTCLSIQFLYVYKVQIFVSSLKHFATGPVTWSVFGISWIIYLETSFEINMLSID